MNDSLQLVGGALRVFVLGQHSRNIFIGHMPIDSVAAQKESRAVARVYRFDLHFDLVFDSQRPVDYIAAREFGCLFRPNPTGPQGVVEIGVIDRLSAKPPVFEAINAAVPDMSDGGLPAGGV